MRYFNNLDALQYSTIEYKENDFITKQGFRTDNLTIILEGKIKIFEYDTNGKIQNFFIHEGEMFLGDMEYASSSFISGNVQAITNIKAIVIPIEKNRLILEKDTVFLNFLIQNLYHKAIGNSSILFSNASSHERVLNYLSTIHQDTIDISLQDLASVLRISYRQLLRTLKQLEQEGILIRIKKGQYKKNTDLSVSFNTKSD